MGEEMGTWGKRWAHGGRDGHMGEEMHAWGKICAMGAHNGEGMSSEATSP